MTQDIVYNSTTNLWACCYGSGELDCSDPSDETFEAPSPEQLASMASSAPSSTQTSSASSPTSLALTSLTSSSAVTSSPQITSISYPTSDTGTPNTGLSTGAKAGISIAAAIRRLLVIAILLICIQRSRQRKRIATEGRPAIRETWTGYTQPRDELDAKRSMELDSQAQVELDAQHGRGELE